MPHLTRLRKPGHPVGAAVAALALCATALLAPAPAIGGASSVASSASQSVGVSIGSVSGSLKTSSGSSSPTGDVAAADYEVIAIAAVAGRASMLHLTLRAGAAAPHEFVLELPRQAVEQGQLAPGCTVSARHRPYGLEFASAETRAAFFLLLDDDWLRDFALHAVGT